MLEYACYTIFAGIYDEAKEGRKGGKNDCKNDCMNE